MLFIMYSVYVINSIIWINMDLLFDLMLSSTGAAGYLSLHGRTGSVRVAAGQLDPGRDRRSLDPTGRPRLCPHGCRVHARTPAGG